MAIDRSQIKLNAVPNGFIPHQSPLVISRTIARLPLESIYNLCQVWAKIPIAQPRIDKNELLELEMTKAEFLQTFIDTVTMMQEKNKNKRKIIDKILVEYYKKGLNLLQYAQIDSQLIIDKPQSHVWQITQIIDATGSQVVINLTRPQDFLESLLMNLSKYFMNHIYISRHPHFPMIIIRIQLFDLINHSLNRKSEINTNSRVSNSMISRKPFFLGIPMNSSNLVYSYTLNQEVDPTVTIILQCIESSLSDTLNKQIRIKQESASQPIKSLESAHILSGNSRFSKALGAWAPYADGTVDISPFDDPSRHSTFEENVNLGALDVDERRRKISRLRFKGSLNKLNSQEKFENVRPYKKRKTRRIGDSSDDEDDQDYVDIDEVKQKKKEAKVKKDLQGDQSLNDEIDEYSSITPIQNIQFELRNDLNSHKTSIAFKLQGADVFGGLHELCDRGQIDPESIPGYLTGEEGLRSGVVEDGTFIVNKVQKKRESQDDGSLI